MTTTIYDILGELYSASTSERDKGDRFERLMAAYLRNDPVWSQRFSDVWLWEDWPERPGVDTGIDLVAAERNTGDLTAIQCKFYSPTHTLQKADIDSFFTASGKAGFASRLIISTTDKWSKHAEDALVGQQIPTSRLRVQDLDESGIDWSLFSLRTPEVMELKDRKVLRPHQQDALRDVFLGWELSDRGQMIMACGTGKTFTALRIAEALVPLGGQVLFLVPSISLLSQTLKEWSGEAEVSLMPFVVCSDTKVGKKDKDEDISHHDLPFPASTDATKLYERVTGSASSEQVSVVFSTYQSLPVVAAAQEKGLPGFDLIVCDEAHRTTGATLSGEDESNFVKIHDPEFVRGKKRLYMTATPRIYDDASKSKAVEGSAVLASMDDENVFGPEFHRLGFGDAVNRGLLTDYKVLVLAVDEEAVSTTFQSQLADKNSELGIDDAAKIVGCWNGLAKKGRGESGFGDDRRPMGRAVAFARSIKDSQRFARLFTEISSQYAGIQEESDEDSLIEVSLNCEVEHVDGTFNALERNKKLDWLKAPLAPDSCRILSNARCLAEGVDVPALDAVMFLNPRNSVVDVVQSVGRIMRLAPDKEYGYVILPIGIPADLTPEQALANNEKYKVVWQVLQALRAHDERFNAMVNQLELNKKKPERLQVIGVGDFREEGGPSDTPASIQQVLNFPEIGEWRDAIYAKIVKKVGDRRYWEDWAKDVSAIAERHTTRIKALLSDPSLDVSRTFEDFLGGLRASLNDGISSDDAIDMLAQHLITKPIFDALFEGYSFADHNPVSRVMQTMIDALDAQNLSQEQEGLEKFYESVGVRAAGIDNAAGKQRIINELYEKFFKIAFPRVAESLGIVYTPVQIVDFIIQSVEHALTEEFGASITDKGVHVLDPFTGTGTFVTRLLESGLIRPEDMLRKYREEVHANEVLLLAYYIAAINIEATFHGLTGGSYVPFGRVVLTDTFQMTEAGDTMDQLIFPDNNERVAHQKALDIRVVMGNPPYSVGQGSENDDNKNLAYPALDKAIRDTYAALSKAGLKRNLYDSYIRAFRWASDRIGDQGVICFVSNGSFIDGPFADGFRQTLVKEFSSIYVYNLRGNQRTSGEISRREGGKVFGQGSRTPVAITLLVKNPGVEGCALRYSDIGDYLTRDEKLEIVSEAKSIASVPWQVLQPDASGDWINQRDELFETFDALGAKKEKDSHAIFNLYSLGVVTNRDAWAYNFSKAQVRSNMERMIGFFSDQLKEFEKWLQKRDVPRTDLAVDEFIERDPLKISWTANLKSDLRRNKSTTYNADRTVVSMYRPFCKQWLYFDRRFNERVYQLPKIFPTRDHDNLVIAATGVGASRPFSALMTNVIPNLDLVEKGQCFPLYTYEPAAEGGLFGAESDATGYVRKAAIPDAALERFRRVYGVELDKTDIFYYVYGLLHSPEYLRRFSSDLKKMIARIPLVEDFWGFSQAGQDLAKWHLDYENIDPWPVDEVATDSASDLRVTKMRFQKGANGLDKSTIVYNSSLTLTAIPLETYEYEITGKSAVEWIMDRYQVKTDKDTGIINDPNDWSAELGNPRYVVDLVRRIITVSVRSAEIIKSLPPLNLAVSG